MGDEMVLAGWDLYFGGQEVETPLHIGAMRLQLMQYFREMPEKPLALAACPAGRTRTGVRYNGVS
jgi:hypothetical protein